MLCRFRLRLLANVHEKWFSTGLAWSWSRSMMTDTKRNAFQWHRFSHRHSCHRSTNFGHDVCTSHPLIQLVKRMHPTFFASLAAHSIQVGAYHSRNYMKYFNAKLAQFASNQISVFFFNFITQQWYLGFACDDSVEEKYDFSKIW